MAGQKCRDCGTVKPLSEFHYRKDNRKYRPSCKRCRNRGSAATRYKLTVEELDALYVTHADRCSICGTHADDIGHATFVYSPLVVDHNHDTGKVRGLLCPTCNIGLGQFKNSTKLLEEAIKYLQASG